MICPNCNHNEVGRFELLCESCISRKNPLADFNPYIRDIDGEIIDFVPCPDTEFVGISSVETPIDVPIRRTN